MCNRNTCISCLPSYGFINTCITYMMNSLIKRIYEDQTDSCSWSKNCSPLATVRHYSASKFWSDEDHNDHGITSNRSSKCWSIDKKNRQMELIGNWYSEKHSSFTVMFAIPDQESLFKQTGSFYDNIPITKLFLFLWMKISGKSSNIENIK